MLVLSVVIPCRVKINSWLKSLSTYLLIALGLILPVKVKVNCLLVLIIQREFDFEICFDKGNRISVCCLIDCSIGWLIVCLTVCSICFCSSGRYSSGFSKTSNKIWLFLLLSLIIVLLMFLISSIRLKLSLINCSCNDVGSIQNELLDHILLCYCCILLF